jgi:LVIVD repeat-containing protein
MSRVLAVAVALAVFALALATQGDAQVPDPLNDLGALGQGTGQTPTMLPKQRNSEPPLKATPRADCGPGSHPEPDVQGRVPDGSATNGLDCNISLVSHQGTSGGFKVQRYVDSQGHDCAYYDTALLFPLNAVNLAGPSLGVVVLDMSDPSKPVQTDSLTEPPMLSPHESLNLNQKRGLLAAVNGNPSTYPGLVSIYDVRNDCRHPVLQSTELVARLGHESGFSQDGLTFYATGTATQAITAIDVTDPQNPHAIWQGNVLSHGMSLSDDGNRAYIADASGGDMAILDTSEIQARKPDPQVREVSRLTWESASIPQNALPFTRDGKPYILEFDEYTAATLNPGANADDVGAGRIIDISDETKPHVVSNLRLQINQDEDHAAARAAGDPGTQNPAQGYAAHYCNIPTRVDPKVVACSFIASGLRVFDISDLSAPKEIAYFVSPPVPRVENGFSNSDFAMSQPAFVPERREVWYTDGESGFYALRVAKSVWPTAGGAQAPGGGACTARTKARHLKVRKRQATSVRAKLTRAGKRVRGATVRLRGPGFKRHKKTGANGRVLFKVRAKRTGRATVSSGACGGKLTVSASRAPRRSAGPDFTG